MGVDFEDLPCFLTDSRTRSGQSGSPVVRYSDGAGGHRMSDGALAMTGGPLADLVGVYSGRMSKDSDLGHVWKRQALVEIATSGTRGSDALRDPLVPVTEAT